VVAWCVAAGGRGGASLLISDRIAAATEALRTAAVVVYVRVFGMLADVGAVWARNAAASAADVPSTAAEA
jgi:hypothetical protein